MARHRPLWLPILIAIALAWPAQGAELAPERTARLGRSLLQPSPQIPQACGNGFSQAYPFCSDVASRTAGSLCCNGLLQLGTDCLSAVQASLSSSNGDNSAMQQLTDTLSACQISLAGSTPPTSSPSPASPPVTSSPPAPGGSNDTCLSGFSAALTACGGSGSACCDPVSALGDTCLSELAGTSDLFASVTFGQIAQACGFNTTGGGGDEQLPDGTILISWTALGRDGAACPVWNGTNFQSGTAPSWNATGTDMPADAEILAVAERWCTNRESAVAEMFQALDLGGHSAQVAVAAFILYTCPTDNKDLWDIMDLINSGPLNDPSTAGKYVKAIADAAEQDGLNFCAAVVVASNLTGRVLFYKDYHSGPGADEPNGCLPNFQQAQVICSYDTVAPAQPCCDAVGALGATCRATVAASADPSVGAAYASIAGSCGPFAEAPSPSTGGLPAGEISIFSSYGPTAQCYLLDAFTGNFTADSNSTWAAASNDDVLQSDVQAFAAQMCPLAEGAGPLLVQAFSAGGDQAKVAAFVLTRTGVCTNQTANDAALNAFFNAVTKDRENLLSLVQSLVDAADQVGAGFCVTVAVTDTQSGAVLFQEEIHTSVAAPGSAPVLSRRRRLRGLGGGAGAPQRALGRGRARAAGQR